MGRRTSSKSGFDLGLFLVTASLGLMALLQNRYGQFSDIRGFYGMHFSDGQSQWPFSYHTLLGTTIERHPVEYPALTGLIMWLISFLIPVGQMAVVHYYWLTAALNIGLLCFSALLVRKLSDNKWAYLFVFAPAVLYSLNRNWDIWALVPMLISVLYFEQKRYSASAISLAIAIATKFFPVVLLLPIAIVFFRERRWKSLVEYGVITTITWIVINLPFALINFEGWFYFYKFSFERGLGSGSVYELMKNLGSDVSVPAMVVYLLNATVFAIVALFLLLLKKPATLAESAFYALFAFTLFNKQYSVQYVIWLAPFAVIALSGIIKRKRRTLLVTYFVWQISELLFQYALFQNSLTNMSIGQDVQYAQVEIDNLTYGVIALFRYLVAILFVSLLIHKRSSETPVENSKSGGSPRRRR